MISFKTLPVQRKSVIARAYFEADNGWTSVALQRLENLLEDFPEDPQILFALGQIRQLFLGEGLRGREFYERAFQANKRHPFAAANATMLARDEQEFAKWAALTRQSTPTHPNLKLIADVAKNLEAGLRYSEHLVEGASQYAQANEHGLSASIMEVALQAPQSQVSGMVEARRGRAQSLRELDAVAARARDTRLEFFAPDERLTLIDAIAEIDVAIGIDPYDAELWNLKAAWCHLLHRFEAVLEYADKALQLRPNGYPKPYQNKAAALRALKRNDEARQNAQKALEIALAMGSRGSTDAELARGCLDSIAPADQKPSDQILEEVTKQVIGAAHLTSEKLAGLFRNGVQSVSQGLYLRTRKIGLQWSNRYIPLMCELLTDFMPETCIELVLTLPEHSQVSYDNCIHAVLYIAVYAKGVMRRDAARFLVLLLLGGIEAPRIRKAYREAILAPSAASAEFSELAGIIGDAFRRLNPILYEQIAIQPAATAEEIEFARRVTLSRFDEEAMSATPQVRSTPSGCATPIVLATLVVVLILTIYHFRAICGWMLA